MISEEWCPVRAKDQEDITKLAPVFEEMSKEEAKYH